MLESSLNLEVLTMEQSSELSNQQERLVNLAWFAGLVEGEGNISLVQGASHRIMPRFGIINTDYRLIDASCAVLTENNIGHYITLRKGGCDNNPKHRDAKVVTVAGHKRMAKLLPILIPYLRGKKREVAEVVKEYVEYRLGLPSGSQYTSKDVEYINRVRTLNKKGPQESSETIRWIPSRNGLGKDIVQAA
jgi:hypothetical protein